MATDRVALEMVEVPFNVLFVCAHHQSRALFATALLNDLSGGRFRAFAASMKPAPEPRSLAVATLRRWGHEISAMRLLGMSELHGDDVPPFDFVFCLCERNSDERCAPWLGPTLTANWDVPDPFRSTGTLEERADAFEEAYETLRARIEVFAMLPIARLQRVAGRLRSDRIGSVATPGADRPLYVS